MGDTRMTPEEALKILKKVKSLLRKKLKGVSPAPWKWDDSSIRDVKGTYVLDDGSAGGEYGSLIDGNCPDGEFIPFSRIVVPVVLKTIAAVLKKHETSQWYPPDGTGRNTAYKHGIMETLVTLAEELKGLLDG